MDDAFAKWLTGMSPKQNKANQRKLKNWMERTSNKSESPTDLLPFEVTLDDTSSLGTIWKHDRTSRAAGNTVAILLKRSAHKPGYMVYTAYPK